MSTQTAAGFLNQVDIYGRDGSISMRPCGFLDYEFMVNSRVVEEYKQPAVIHVPVAGDVRDVKHSRQLKEFVEAIRSGKPTFTTAFQARKVMEVIDAVFASSRSCEPVPILSKVQV